MPTTSCPLIAGVLALLRGKRRIAIGAVVFAIAGFCVGLSMTAREGAVGDIAYHVTMLPILAFTLVSGWRLPRPGPSGRPRSPAHRAGSPPP